MSNDVIRKSQVIANDLNATRHHNGRRTSATGLTYVRHHILAMSPSLTLWVRSGNHIVICDKFNIPKAPRELNRAALFYNIEYSMLCLLTFGNRLAFHCECRPRNEFKPTFRDLFAAHVANAVSAVFEFAQGVRDLSQ